MTNINQPEDPQIPEDMRIAIEKAGNRLATIEADAARFSRAKASAEKDLANLNAEISYKSERLEKTSAELKDAEKILADTVEATKREIKAKDDAIEKATSARKEADEIRAILKEREEKVVKREADVSAREDAAKKREENLSQAELDNAEKARKLRDFVSTF